MDEETPQLYILTVLEDDEGMVHLNYDGLEAQHALWLLESAKHILLDNYWSEEVEDE